MRAQVKTTANDAAVGASCFNNVYRAVYLLCSGIKGNLFLF